MTLTANSGARLGEMLGHRRVFGVGVAIFTAFSLGCGVAPSPATLVPARVGQSLGAALLIPQVLSLLQLHFRGAARRRAVGVYSMVLALGVALGQVLGGLLVSADLASLSWRPIFLINVPVGAVVLLILRRAVPEDGAATPGLRGRLDVSGNVLLAAGMAAFTAALTLGRESGWPLWTWPVLISGLLLIGGFVRHLRRTPVPLLDLAALRPRGMKAGLLACAVVNGCYAVFLFVFTVHLQSDSGWSAFAAGAAFLPYTLGFAVMSLGWPRLPDRIVHRLPTVGPVVFAAAVIGFGSGTAMWALAPLMVLAGAGHAAGFSPLISRLTESTSRTHASAVSALNATGPQVAQVVAIAVGGAIYLAAGVGWALGVTAVVLLAGAACAASLPATRGVRDLDDHPEAPDASSSPSRPLR